MTFCMAFPFICNRKRMKTMYWNVLPHNKKGRKTTRTLPLFFCPPKRNSSPFQSIGWRSNLTAHLDQSARTKTIDRTLSPILHVRTFRTFERTKFQSIKDKPPPNTKFLRLMSFSMRFTVIHHLKWRCWYLKKRGKHLKFFGMIYWFIFKISEPPSSFSVYISDDGDGSQFLCVTQNICSKKEDNGNNQWVVVGREEL